MLREHDCDEIIENPIPKDVDANGAPIPMNARERQDFNRELRAYKEKDKIAYARMIMKACRLNPKTKLLCESGTLKTANKILEQMEYTALREMGINIDDSLRLTKFIQQDTYNKLKAQLKHKSLAQTIFNTPNMTLSRATSLFETYHPGEQPAESSAPSVNAIFCTYCHKSGHKVNTFRNKIRDEKDKKRKNSSSPTEHSSEDSSSGKRQRFPCCICEAKDHKTHECPRMPEVRKCLGNRKKSAWGQDETFDDEYA
jgi:hypothetical protein